ncbi:MAG: hypothetical protein EAZ91_19485 [Cytophagales bacterium]|nr:MAG: hypothetical protein EAZ91_19485 [Cytophagales bacterium]
MRSTLRKSGLLLVGLLVGIVLVGLFRLDLTNEQLQRANDQHRLRYDSLLASKLEAEKHLTRLRTRADSLRPRVAPSVFANPNGSLTGP